jgi:hypothetical protein
MIRWIATPGESSVNRFADAIATISCRGAFRERGLRENAGRRDATVAALCQSTRSERLKSRKTAMFLEMGDCRLIESPANWRRGSE